jgi:hypothetical protein
VSTHFVAWRPQILDDRAREARGEDESGLWKSSREPLDGARLGRPIETHIEVDPAMTVKASHEIAGRVRTALQRELAWVADVLVRVEPATELESAVQRDD